MATVAKRRDRWVIDFYDHQGKRRWITLPKGATKKKAKDKLRQIEDQVARGIFIMDKKIPTFKEVAEDWLVYKKPNIRSSTYDMYRGHIKNHLNEFNYLTVSKFTTVRIEKFITKKRTAGMNLTTLRKLIVTLNQIMKYAVRHNYIAHNPLVDAERPKRQEQDEQPEITVFNPEQINRFLDAAECPKHKNIFMLAIMSGARQGEILGLKWSDVQWDNNQIHIQRTFNHGQFRPPKTKKSNRKIDLGPVMMSELKRWRLASMFSQDDDLIFGNDLGKPLHQSNMLRRHYHPTLAAAGLPKIKFHSLRHTYASLKIEQGENLIYISEQMGHSSPVVTSTVYAHLIKKTNFESACGLEEMIFEKNGSNMVAEIKKEVEQNVLTS